MYETTDTRTASRVIRLKDWSDPIQLLYNTNIDSKDANNSSVIRNIQDLTRLILVGYYTE